MHGYPVARTSAPQDPRSKARANPTCRSCMSFRDHHPGATWSSGKYSRECLNLLCHCEIVRKDLRPIPSLRIYHERIFTSRLSLSRWWLTQTPRSFLFVRDTLGSTPGDATVASQLRVRNAYPQEWACIRNRACLLTGYEASPHQLANMRHLQRLSQSGLYPVPSERLVSLREHSDQSLLAHLPCGSPA